MYLRVLKQVLLLYLDYNYIYLDIWTQYKRLRSNFENYAKFKITITKQNYFFIMFKKREHDRAYKSNLGVR